MVRRKLLPALRALSKFPVTLNVKNSVFWF